MSIYSTIKRTGLLPTLYKLKHLYLMPSSYIVTQSAQNGVYEYLQRYKYAIKKTIEMTNLPKIKDSKYIWICWLQGIENAPLLVRRCVESIQKNNSNREVIIISEETMSQYITLPKYIIQKHNAEIIPHAHFSDIVRLFLLQEYGGVWIDSTILMTDCLPSYIEDSSFFIYHSSTEQGHVCCANGFIASCQHHPIVEEMLSLLLEYWKKENRLVSYSIFHLFFFMLTHQTLGNTINQIWENLPLYYYTECEKLRICLNQPFNPTLWAQIRQSSPIHKLTYKFNEYHIDPSKKGTFYDVLINQNTPTC